MKEIRWELILMPLVSIVLGIYLIMQPVPPRLRFVR